MIPCVGNKLGTRSCCMNHVIQIHVGMLHYLYFINTFTFVITVNDIFNRICTVFVDRFGCFEDLCRFSNLSHIATWKQEITRAHEGSTRAVNNNVQTIWYRSDETGNQTLDLLLCKLNHNTTAAPSLSLSVADKWTSVWSKNNSTCTIIMQNAEIICVYMNNGKQTSKLMMWSLTMDLASAL